MKQGDRWLIFYTDGTVFGSADGNSWEAPRRDVQVVVSCKDSKENDWYAIAQCNQYYYESENGGWNDCSDKFTMYDHLLRAKYPCVIFGRMLSDMSWKETHAKIMRYCEDNRDWLVGMTDERPKKRHI